MNHFQKLSRKIIELSFDFSVATIEKFSKMEKYNQQVDELRKLDKGTLGREIADCLDAQNYSLVPNFESHDLKHVLLNYKMTPEEEIRMQAFMIGNGNYSIPSFAILIFGFFLLPDLWLTFYKDFQKGRNSIAVSKWTIQDFADRNLVELQASLMKPASQEKHIFMIQPIIRLGAFVSIISGVFGMIFCLPFLFSSNIADLVGAGFPFVGGAILAVGGLIALSNLAKNDKNQIKYIDS